MSESVQPAETFVCVRLDAWLDVACLFPTRSLAQRACKTGQVEVNGQAAKPHRLVQPGDEVCIARGHSHRQKVVVRGSVEHHIARSLARQLYEDRTPPPTPELLEDRRIRRLLREVAPAPTGAPHRRDRRTARTMRGKG